MANSDPISSLSDEGRSHIVAFMEASQGDSGHMRHVANLALHLFDQLLPLHGEDDKARGILEAAALLHDIGFAVSERRHHKHTRDLILKHPIPGMSEEETRAVACVARYHRRAEPSMKHALFAKLGEPMRQTVRHLSALLRVADGLDRAHRGNVSEIRAEILENTVDLRLLVGGDVATDLAGLNRKKGYFESLFVRTLVVELEERPAERRKTVRRPKRRPAKRRRG